MAVAASLLLLLLALCLPATPSMTNARVAVQPTVLKLQRPKMLSFNTRSAPSALQNPSTPTAGRPTVGLRLTTPAISSPSTARGWAPLAFLLGLALSTALCVTGRHVLRGRHHSTVQNMAASLGVFEGRLPFLDPMALESRVPLGKTGLSIAPLGIGTWAWGNKLLWGYDEAADPSLQEAFDEALAAGVNFFDTGDSYGTGKLEGQAERLLGQFWADHAQRRSRGAAARAVFATKLAVYPWRLTGASFESACRASLTRMALPSLEVAQAHWSASNYAPWQEPALWDGLCRCYEAGLCRAVGASNFGPRQLRKFAAYCEARGVPLVLDQVQFSLLSTAPLESGLLEVCQELGITIIAYSPLALGTLSGKYTLSPDGRRVVTVKAGDSLPAGPRRFLLERVLPGAPELLETLQAVAQQRRRTVAQVALNWCMCKGAVPIVGARSKAQVRDNLGALGWRLTAGEVAALDAAARKARRKATQNVFMTG
eukprot:EG_transcript_6896